MPEETQAGPCAELTKALEACLAENVSKIIFKCPRIVGYYWLLRQNAFSLGGK